MPGTFCRISLDCSIRALAVLERDQKLFIGHVLCLCNHCVGGYQYAFAPDPTFLLPLPVGKQKGARGRLGVRRSTGTEHGEHPFHRGGETHALHSNLPCQKD